MFLFKKKKRRCSKWKIIESLNSTHHVQSCHTKYFILVHTKLWGGINSCNSSLLNSVTVHHEPNGVVARGTPHSAKTTCSKNDHIYDTLFLSKDDLFQSLLFCVSQSFQINRTLYSLLHTTTFNMKITCYRAWLDTVRKSDTYISFQWRSSNKIYLTITCCQNQDSVLISVMFQNVAGLPHTLSITSCIPLDATT